MNALVPFQVTRRLAVTLLFTVAGWITPVNAQPAVGPDAGAAAAQPPASSFAGAIRPGGSANDREIDRQHLQRIYQAIAAYYRDHQDLPNWLSDLVPQYLPDASDLVSPVEKRTGKSILYGREDPQIHTSYVYEFNAGPAPEEFNRGRNNPLSCKEWKLMQLRKFGLVTPILRCHLHNPVLNVAYSGDLYETGLMWENDSRTAALIQTKPQLGPQATEAPSSLLKVRLLDAKTEEPIPAVLVQSALGSEFGLLPPGQNTADTNGVATIALGDWKVNFLFLTASHPRYQTKQVGWNREQRKDAALPTELTIKLVPKVGDGAEGPSRNPLEASPSDGSLGYFPSVPDGAQNEPSARRGGSRF